LKGKNVLEGLRLGAGGAVWSPLGRSLKIKICSMGPAARFLVSSLMEKALFKHFQQAVPSFMCLVPTVRQSSQNLPIRISVASIDNNPATA
jgi:hypothetical protein